VYIDAAAFLPHVPPRQLPGQSLVAELYVEGGIRGVEVGTVMFGREDPSTGEEETAAMELVRLAMPRRVYTQSHVDFMVEAIVEVYRRRDRIGGFEFSYQAPVLRHFTAEFKPLYVVGGG
jgi:tryptophanase